MYTNKTTHFDIPLPLGSDLTTPMDYNESMEAIDNAIWTAAQDSATATGTAAQAKETADTAATDVLEAKNDILTLRGQQNVLNGRLVSLETEVDDVRQDSKDMICAFQEPSASSTRRYEVGDYFIYNDVLYKATVIINPGDTIIPNTNCSATNVTTELGDGSAIAEINQKLGNADISEIGNSVTDAIVNLSAGGSAAKIKAGVATVARAYNQVKSVTVTFDDLEAIDGFALTAITGAPDYYTLSGLPSNNALTINLLGMQSDITGGTADVSYVVVGH